MGGVNDDICYVCRGLDHWIETCPVKRHCQKCRQGYLRYLEVVKLDSPNRGRLFFKCNVAGYGYFEWNDTTPSRVDSSTAGPMTQGEEDGLSQLLRTCARVIDEEDASVEVKFEVTKKA